MPLYLFSNPANPKEIIEVILSVHEKHEYIKDGIAWNREFTVPNASIDSQWNAESEADFINKTGNKKGTVDNLWEKSRELSEKREKIFGKDPVKEKYYKKWSKQRKGKIHPTLRKEQAKKNLNKLGVDLS